MTSHIHYTTNMCVFFFSFASRSIASGPSNSHSKYHAIGAHKEETGRTKGELSQATGAAPVSVVTRNIAWLKYVH